MKLTRLLAALAAVPVLTGPLPANPPCFNCGPPVVVRRVAKPEVRVEVQKEKEVIIKKEIATVAVPHFVPTYVSTILPAPSVTYNIQTPPAPLPQTYQQSASYSAASVTYPAPPVGFAGYGAAQAQQFGAAAGGERDQLAAVLAKINDRLCAVEEKLGVKPPAAPVPGPQLGGVAKCAACHDQAVADAKGRKIVLTVGGRFKDLTGAEAMKIRRKVLTGEMPPKGNAEGVAPLTDAESAELFDAVARAVK